MDPLEQALRALGIQIPARQGRTERLAALFGSQALPGQSVAAADRALPGALPHTAGPIGPMSRPRATPQHALQVARLGAPPMPPTVSGALADVLPPPDDLDAQYAQRDAMEMGDDRYINHDLENGPGTIPGAPGVTPPPGRVPQPNMIDLYRQKMAMIRSPGTALTEQQKKDRGLEIGLAMLAASSRPGSSLLGGIGEAGMRGTALGRAMEAANQDQAGKLVKGQQENVKNEVGIMDKDEDNKRQAARDKATEAHQAELIKIREKELAGLITHREAETERKKLVDDHKAEIDKERALTAKADAASKDAFRIGQIEVATERNANSAARLREARDNTPADVRTAQWWANATPQQKTAYEEMQRIRRPERDREEEQKQRAYDKYVSDFDKSIMNTGKQPLSRAAFEARGSGTGDVKPDPAGFKDKIIVGPDGRWKSDGKKWVKL